VIAVAAVADPVPVEGGRLHQARRARLVVPAVDPERRERSRLLDADPGRVLSKLHVVTCTENGRVVVVVELAHRELDRLARLPAMGADDRLRRRLGAVVAQRLFAAGKVEPDDGTPVPVGEADAGLPERALLGRQQRAAAREDRRRRAAVGAEAPRVGLYARDVDMPLGEAGIDAQASRRTGLAVEDARHEPVRVVRRRQLQLDADTGVDRLGPLVGHGEAAVEPGAVDGRAVRRDRHRREHSSLRPAARRRDRTARSRVSRPAGGR